MVVKCMLSRHRTVTSILRTTTRSPCPNMEWPQGSQYHIYFHRVVHLARKADYTDSRDLYL